jgi:hypothetical protein
MSVQPGPNACGALATTTCPLTCGPFDSSPPVPCGTCEGGYYLALRVVGPEGQICGAHIEDGQGSAPHSENDWVISPAGPFTAGYTGCISLTVAEDVYCNYCDGTPPTQRRFTGGAGPVDGPAYVTIEVEQIWPPQ